MSTDRRYILQRILLHIMQCYARFFMRSVEKFELNPENGHFSQIKQRERNFRPTGLFDFGSGAGSVMWYDSSLSSSDWCNLLVKGSDTCLG